MVAVAALVPQEEVQETQGALGDDTPLLLKDAWASVPSFKSQENAYISTTICWR
jgi:hypothetical protein